jgi:membrane protein YqaA with SNARE-associated domain
VIDPAPGAATAAPPATTPLAPSSVPAPSADVAAPRSRNPIRRIYEWVLSWAETPYGVPALFVLAFVESSFFPIPPDVLLIALALAVPTRAFRFALWCTVGSVIGGLFGYFIGFALWSTFEPYLIPTVFGRDKFDMVTAKYNEYGELAVFIAAFTPIPYKVFTVAAGVAKLNLIGFTGASIVGRGGRFFLVALVIRLAGPRAKQLIDKYFNLVTIVGTALLIGAFLLLRAL